MRGEDYIRETLFAARMYYRAFVASARHENSTHKDASGRRGRPLGLEWLALLELLSLREIQRQSPSCGLRRWPSALWIRQCNPVGY